MALKSQQIKTPHKNLGRGLSALIPDSDMAFLSQVARGESVGSTPQTSAHTSTNNSLKNDADPKVPSAKTFKNKNNSQAPSVVKVNNLSSSSAKSELTAQTSSVVIDSILLHSIEANPYQPRRTFSPQELQDLADSVREHGLLQPIIVRPSSKDSKNSAEPDSLIQYQLVAGERRWRAAQAAGLQSIPAIIRSVTDQQALELALIENVQRHDISAMDAAVAYQRLSKEFSLSQEQVAQRVGKSRSSIANTIRLLDLPQDAQKSIEDGVLSEGHGRAILLAPTDGARRAVLRRILRDKLSVRDSEELARQNAAEESQNTTDDVAPTKIRLSAEAKRIEDGLQKHLGTRVKMKLRRQGGQILINYFSNEELDRVLKLIMK